MPQNHIPDRVLFRAQALTATGSTQATAAVMNSNHSVYYSTGDSISGILLPAASKGATFFVVNNGSGAFGALNLYPAVGDSINALAVNAPLVMASLSACVIIAVSSTLWYSMPRVPS